MWKCLGPIDHSKLASSWTVSECSVSLGDVDHMHQFKVTRIIITIHTSIICNCFMINRENRDDQKKRWPPKRQKRISRISHTTRWVLCNIMSSLKCSRYLIFIFNSISPWYSFAPRTIAALKVEVCEVCMIDTFISYHFFWFWWCWWFCKIELRRCTTRTTV